MANIGLSEQEITAYSLTRAIRAMTFPHNKEYQKDAEFEFDVSTEAAKIEKRDISGIFIPDDVLEHKMIDEKMINERILTAGVDSAGGHTVDDELQSMIDIFLENNFAADNVSVMSGLKGNVFIPGQDERIEAQFTGETEAATEDEPSFREISLTPRHCRTWLRVTKQLLVQSHESVEMFLRRDLSRAISKKVDSSILYGVGTQADMSVASVSLAVGDYVTYSDLAAFNGLSGTKWTFATISGNKVMLFKDLVAEDETKLGEVTVGTQITITDSSNTVLQTVTVSGAYNDTTKRLPISDYDTTGLTNNTNYTIATVAVSDPATYDPPGIVNTSNIQTFTWDNSSVAARATSLVEQVASMEERLAAENVPGASGRNEMMPARNCSVLMSNRMKRYMKLIKFYGENTEIPLLSDDDMLLEEYKANYSTQVALHDFFFCDWKDALLGLWSGIEIMENPYSEDTKGIVKITASQMLDVNVYRPQSMAYCKAA